MQGSFELEGYTSAEHNFQSIHLYMLNDGIVRRKTINTDA